MGKADGGLRKVFQNNLPKPNWRWTPIETGGTHNGVPDSFYLNVPTRQNGWIECKKTDGWAVKFEPHQLSWLPLHSAAGVRTWVAVRGLGVGSGGGLGDSLWLAAGQHAEAIERLGLNGVPPETFIYKCFGDPKVWDWGLIARILTGVGR